MLKRKTFDNLVSEKATTCTNGITGILLKCIYLAENKYWELYFVYSMRNFYLTRDNFGENDEKSSSKRNNTNVEQSMVNWLIVNETVLMTFEEKSSFMRR